MPLALVTSFKPLYCFSLFLLGRGAKASRGFAKAAWISSGSAGYGIVFSGWSTNTISPSRILFPFKLVTKSSVLSFQASVCDRPVLAFQGFKNSSDTRLLKGFLTTTQTSKPLFYASPHLLSYLYKLYEIWVHHAACTGGKALSFSRVVRACS